MIELRIHGRGGQGVVTFAELLSACAMENGSFTQTLPFFGVERRGAAVKATVRIDDAPIKIRSASYHPDYIVLFNANLADTAKKDGVQPGTIYITNGASGENTHLVDADALAYEYGLVRGIDVYINIIMVGAVCKILGISADIVKKVIMEKRGVEENDPNVKAALSAYETIIWKGGAK